MFTGYFVSFINWLFILFIYYLFIPYVYLFIINCLYYYLFCLCFEFFIWSPQVVISGSQQWNKCRHFAGRGSQPHTIEALDECVCDSNLMVSAMTMKPWQVWSVCGHRILGRVGHELLVLHIRIRAVATVEFCPKYSLLASSNSQLLLFNNQSVARHAKN